MKYYKLSESLENSINTVDAFQGQEKEIVIFNCVRSNKILEKVTKKSENYK